jgi:predicted transcriptional regulator
MDIELRPDQMTRLSEIAEETGRGTDELVRQAVDQIISENEWLRQQAKIGIEQVERGEFLEEEEMASRVDRLLSLTLTRDRGL